MFLLGEINSITTTVNNTANNKVKSNHTSLNIYTSVQNLVFCRAGTLSYTWKSCT